MYKICSNCKRYRVKEHKVKGQYSGYCMIFPVPKDFKHGYKAKNGETYVEVVRNGGCKEFEEK